MRGVSLIVVGVWGGAEDMGMVYGSGFVVVICDFDGHEVGYGPNFEIEHPKLGQ